MNNLVSILMTTRNRSGLLHRSVESLCQQTYKNLEILIFNDGSTDDTAAVLANLAKIDPRIRVFQSGVSVGIATALNRLIEASRGRYLARMDDDDVAYPKRIEKQLAFMAANHLDVCGTGYRRVAGLRRSVILPPVSHQAIRAGLLFQPPLAHPTVMLRRDLIERYGGYRTDFPYAEDYELWVRLIEHGRFGNVPEVLIDYTLSPRQVSRACNIEQVQSARRVRALYLSRLGFSYDAAEAEIHVGLRDPIPIESLTALERAGEWLHKLSKLFPPDCVPVFQRQWFLCGVRAAGLGPKAFRVWRSFPLAPDITDRRRWMLWILCQSRLRYRSRAFCCLEPLVSDRS